MGNRKALNDMPKKELKIPYRMVKRFFDCAGSVFLMTVSAPASAMIASAIKLETPGSVFFIHRRLGKNGKLIDVYKFRSMKREAEDLEKSLNDEELEAYYKEYRLSNDPRVTKTGRILRRSHLDELPQFINILRGDMSLVGPRPVTEAEMEFYSDEEKMKLLSVRPGLTGYWQVFGRGRATYNNGERVRMELFYADNASVKLDMIILALTPVAVISSLIRDGQEPS
jgi:lipopolysaccharide/colanic/teichoic acid biosynthesis glycosyltransferase